MKEKVAQLQDEVKKLKVSKNTLQKEQEGILYLATEN